RSPLGDVQIQHHCIRACVSKEFEALPVTFAEYHGIAMEIQKRIEERTARCIISDDKDHRHDFLLVLSGGCYWEVCTKTIASQMIVGAPTHQGPSESLSHHLMMPH